MQPGDTITPGASPQPTPEAPQPSPTPVQTAPAPVDPPAAPIPSPTPPEVPTAEAELATDWQYASGEAQEDPSAARPSLSPVSWTASEYVAHQKSMGWYMLSGLALVVAIAVVYLLTKDLVAAIVVALAGVIFGVFSARPPRVLNYSITDTGVQMGQRFYPYHEFKSFAVSEEGTLPSVLLLPLKRFLPPITVFYDPKEEDAIINALSSYLPFEHKQPDAVDKLMARIRF